MNKTLIVGVLVGVVALGGIWALTKGGGDDKMGSEPKAGAMADGTPEDFSGSLTNLIAMGKDITCTFTQQESGATMNGTVYVAAKGQMVRGDFAMSQQGQSFNGSMIRKDGSNYTWGTTPFGPFAHKVNVDAPKSDKGESVDFDESMSYKCSPWKVDESKFSLPSDINFDDLNAEMQKIDAAMQQVDDLKCSACDGIPDAAAKAQCKAALGC